MATTFSTLKTNVGNRVGDTSTTFATIIGTYINQRYKDILKRSNWQGIDDDYTVSATSAAASYSLPSDFGKELYVYDTVNKTDIPSSTLEDLEGAYQSELKDAGTVEAYCIVNTSDGTTRTKKIKFFRSPSSDIDFEVPYILKPTDLSASTDVASFDCDRAIEYGATSDALMYKKQFAKAQYYEGLYEKEIQVLMWDKDNQPNLLHMMAVTPLNRDEGI